ncbi:hypothetical protein FGO68_gene12737 [Halteria grandinella]|uniref:Uncharacterized protein n=1 Tax=Halteria grandinella TaxID=5974 RepID=A0A8J8NM25_HALGN|nr:hypothetical protein FGO68_gene12737 [Halteria grandinella]
MNHSLQQVIGENQQLRERLVQMYDVTQRQKLQISTQQMEIQRSGIIIAQLQQKVKFQELTQTTSTVPSSRASSRGTQRYKISLESSAMSQALTWDKPRSGYPRTEEVSNMGKPQKPSCTVKKAPMLNSVKKTGYLSNQHK